MRTAVAAVAVVGISLLGAAIGMVAFLERSLRDEVRAAAGSRAVAVADSIALGELDGALDAGDAEEEFVQVLAGDGSVAASSRNLAGEPALIALDPGESVTVERVPFEDGPFLAVAARTTSPDGPAAVVVGRSLEDVAEATAAATRALAIGIPILVVLVGAVAWRVVGRALAPVERIRDEVEAISAAELHRRVPATTGADEIARLAETMNGMLDRLQRSQERQRRFVSDASHELRSPVASIRQQAEVAIAHPETTALGELAEGVLEEGLRLQHIVEDLLLLARIDEGRGPLRAGPVDLDDLLLDIAERLRNSSTLRVSTGGVSAARVVGDRGQLERLIRNLADNAVRHAQGEIALSLGRDERGVLLAVDDDGVGIGAAERERVFDRFVRLADARDRDTGGAGLGLSIAREIAALHRGTVAAVESQLGGARLEVHLPPAPDRASSASFSEESDPAPHHGDGPEERVPIREARRRR